MFLKVMDAIKKKHEEQPGKINPIVEHRRCDPKLNRVSVCR